MTVITASQTRNGSLSKFLPLLLFPRASRFDAIKAQNSVTNIKRTDLHFIGLSILLVISRGSLRTKEIAVVNI